MASRQQIAKTVMAISHIYPYFAKDNDKALISDLWESLLKDYSDELVGYGLKSCLTSMSVPPTPADVIKAINNKFAPNKMERWELLQNAISIADRERQRFAFTLVEDNGKSQGENARIKVVETFNSLPSDLKAYIGSCNELVRMSMDNMEFEKSRFLKNFESEATIQEIELKLNEQKRGLLNDTKRNDN